MPSRWQCRFRFSNKVDKLYTYTVSRITNRHTGWILNDFHFVYILFKLLRTLRALLHQASVSNLQQLCDDASDSILLENNGVT